MFKILPLFLSAVFLFFFPAQAQIFPDLLYRTSYSVGTGTGNTAEIAAYDPATKRLFVANSGAGRLEILNVANIRNVVSVASVDMRRYGNGLNSVDVRNGIVAVAVEDSVPQRNGKVVFLNTNGEFQKEVRVGAMPDMVTFSPDGTRVLTANEGEPNDAYTTDPNGSISIITLPASGGIAALTQQNVTTLDFTAYNGKEAELRSKGIRIYGRNASAAQDIEPEYITIAPDSRTAWVTLQENNALAVVDIAGARITDVLPLGYKDHNRAGSGFDASDRGNRVDISPRPVRGMYQPDAIANFEAGGTRYLITANEGDARAYSGFTEEIRVGASGYRLDPTAFPNAAALKADTVLGRLTVTSQLGDKDGDGDFDEIYAYGARSFSIWNAQTGALVYDSGDELERLTRDDPRFGAIFNASNNNTTRKNRSDDKGPEPEGVTVARLGDNVFAYVSLERVGGVMVYDVTNPQQPRFLQYINNRNTAGSATGDLGPEGIIYIPANQSPNDTAMVVLANEISSTLSFYNLRTLILSAEAGPTLTIDVFPNPSVDVFQVQAKGLTGEPTEFSVLNARGQTVSSQTIRPTHGEWRQSVSLHQQPPGLYLFQLRTPKGVMSRKVLRQ